MASIVYLNPDVVDSLLQVKTSNAEDQEVSNGLRRLTIDELIQVAKREPTRIDALRKHKNFISAYVDSPKAKGSSYRLSLNTFALLTELEHETLRAGFHALDKSDGGRSLTTVQSFGDTPKMYRSNTKMFYRIRELADEQESLDWSLYLPNVKFQGFECGGCWAFAANGLIESHLSIALKGQGIVSLSEQYLLDCDRTKNQGCSGGNYYHTLANFAYSTGFVLGKQVPFTFASSAQQCPQWKGATLVTKTSPTNQILFVDQSETALKDALQQGPVAIALSSYNPVFQFYSGGVLDDAASCGTAIDHAALLVGYGVDATSGKKFWLVRNSWGSNWGENGYIRLAREDAQVMSDSNGLGMCGILTQANTISGDSPIWLLSTNASDTTADRLFCTVDFGCSLNSSLSDSPVTRPNGVDGDFWSLSFGSSSVIVISVIAVCGALSLLIIAYLCVRHFRVVDSKQIETDESQYETTGADLRKGQQSTCCRCIRWRGTLEGSSNASSSHSLPAQNLVAEEIDIESPARPSPSKSLSSPTRKMDFSRESSNSPCSFKIQSPSTSPTKSVPSPASNTHSSPLRTSPSRFMPSPASDRFKPNVGNSFHSAFDVMPAKETFGGAMSLDGTEYDTEDDTILISELKSAVTNMGFPHVPDEKRICDIVHKNPNKSMDYYVDLIIQDAVCRSNNEL